YRDIGAASSVPLRLSVDDPVANQSLGDHAILRRKMIAPHDLIVVARVRLSVEDAFHGAPTSRDALEPPARRISGHAPQAIVSSPERASSPPAARESRQLSRGHSRR